MSHPQQNWFYGEATDLAERFGMAAKDAREKMKAHCALADASAHLSDDGREMIVQGDVAGYYIEARAPWGLDGGDLTDPVRMLIRGMCEQRANSREAGCKLIYVVPRTPERRTAA